MFLKNSEIRLDGSFSSSRIWWIRLWICKYVTAIEELAKVDPSVGLSMAAHNSLCIGHIMQFGNEDQRKSIYQN